MVCQNQSIDDSDAPLARDLRLLVRERIASGDSDGQVIDFLVARYGEFVLLKPRFTPHTLLLWLLPPLALVGGGLALWVYSRRRSNIRRPTDPSLLQIDAKRKRRGWSACSRPMRRKSRLKPVRCKRAGFRYDSRRSKTNIAQGETGHGSFHSTTPAWRITFRPSAPSAASSSAV